MILKIDALAFIMSWDLLNYEFSISFTYFMALHHIEHIEIVRFIWTCIYLPYLVLYVLIPYLFLHPTGEGDHPLPPRG